MVRQITPGQINIRPCRDSKRVRFCDECPTRVKIDCQWGLPEPYSLVAIDAANGMGRAFNSFVTVATAAARFAGVAEDVIHPEDYNYEYFQANGSNNGYDVYVYKCVEMEVMIEPDSRALATQSAVAAGPVYIIPWLDPNGAGEGVAAVSNTTFALSTDPTDSIGCIKELCGDTSNLHELNPCPINFDLSTPVAPADVSPTPAIADCQHSKVCAQLKPNLPCPYSGCS